jgi:hypothetical protein
VADPAEWIIDFDGVGPIVLGGPMADATAALDSTDLVPYSQGVDGCLSDLRRVGDTSAGLAVDPDQSGTSVGLITVENYVTEDGEQSEAALPSTEAGITVGSTGTALRETYPDLGEWTTRSGETGYSLDDSSGHRLWFRVDSTTDLVESIALSDADRYPVGGCGA